MGKLQVGLGERSYPILIEDGCFSTIAAELAENHSASNYCIVADDRVADLYSARLLGDMSSKGLDCELLSFPHGEASKNLATVGDLASRAARLGLDRKSMIIALGGGVTGDIAGFLAASFMRGIPFVQVPTSLLAQVDSSVGGKTGVDIPEGKNLFGAFYQPEAVFIDPSVLETLPEDEYRNGLAEVIKYGVIGNPTFMDYLRDKHVEVVGHDRQVLEEIIHTCCRIKADIVSADEREEDIRRILNFGHTIGHAVEATSLFSILHGFGVAIGMVAATRIGLRRQLLSEAQAEKIISLIRLYNLPTEVPSGLDRELIKSYLVSDKKRIGRKTFFILPLDSGEVMITDQVSEADIDAVLTV